MNISETHRQCLLNIAKTWDEISILNELSTLFPLRDNYVHQTSIFANNLELLVTNGKVLVKNKQDNNHTSAELPHPLD